MKYLIFGFLLAMTASANASLSLGDSDLKMSPDGANEFALTIGGFHPTAKFGFRGLPGDKGERFGGNGFLFTADYLHAIVPAFAVGGELGYISRTEQDVSNVVIGAASAATRVRGDTSLLMAIARLRAPGLGWRPYALFGAGLNWTHLDLVGTAPGFQEISIIRGDTSGLALMGRAGIEYVSKKGTFLGLEAGYLHTDVKTYQPTTDGALAGFKSIQVAGDGVSYALRAGVRFGMPDDESGR
jgi:hypothetical protein